MFWGHAGRQIDGPVDNKDPVNSRCGVGIRRLTQFKRHLEHLGLVTLVRGSATLLPEKMRLLPCVFFSSYLTAQHGIWAAGPTEVSCLLSAASVTQRLIPVMMLKKSTPVWHLPSLAVPALGTAMTDRMPHMLRHFGPLATYHAQHGVLTRAVCPAETPMGDAAHMLKVTRP